MISHKQFPERWLKWLPITSIVIFIIVFACVEPFEPKIENTDTGYLVVEGQINIGSNVVTTMELSRTTHVSESRMVNPETRAVVNIEDEDGNRFALRHTSNGLYKSDRLTLSTEKKFRLSIVDENGRQYYSQFVTPLITPPIDTVVWKRPVSGVDIYLTTHDPEKNIHYFLWDFEEIWEVRADFFSFYKYIDGQVIPRSEEETSKLFRCWKQSKPTNLIMESTQHLIKDSIGGKQMVHIVEGHEKLAHRYKAIFTQNAISREAFEYLTMVEKNTSNIGSFFDPQPSELNGNLYCDGCVEPVIGFVGASTTERKQVAIRRLEVPGWIHYGPECNEIYVGSHPDSLFKYFNSGGFVPTMSDGGGGYFAAPPACVDCQLRGGSNIRPENW